MTLADLEWEGKSNKEMLLASNFYANTCVETSPDPPLYGDFGRTRADLSGDYLREEGQISHEVFRELSFVIVESQMLQHIIFLLKGSRQGDDLVA